MIDRPSFDAPPLIDPPAQSMTLSDGRTVTWQEFGHGNGRPVLYFHGGGSCSAEAGIFHREAVQHDIRLIAANRPGAGGSSPCPGRPVAAYADDVRALVDHLNVDKFACFGESNGGMITLAIAAALSKRVLGAVPINPTLPWFDPMARKVSSSFAGRAYTGLKYLRWLLVRTAPAFAPKTRRHKDEDKGSGQRFNPLDLVGPPPGTESDVGEVLWHCMTQMTKRSLSNDLTWVGNWGFDYYSIPVPLDFFCGVHDVQAPFAAVLADENPNARFHYFRFGHYGFCHPDARRRIVGTIANYL